MPETTPPSGAPTPLGVSLADQSDDRSASARGSRARAKSGGKAPRSGAASGVRVVLARHPVRSLVATLAVVLGIVLVGGALWYQSQVSEGPGGPKVIVTVTPGSSVGTVTRALAHDGVIGSSLAFRIYLFLHGAPLVRPGGYFLHRHEGFADVRDTLARGPDVFSLSIPAGFTVAEVAAKVGTLPGHDSAAFLSVAHSGAVPSPWLAAQAGVPYNLDGLLGTGTYVVVPGESDRQLLQQMVNGFDTEAAAANLQSGSAALHITPYQAVTVASIVQKEGVYPQNLGKVARVVYNRMAGGIKLQMDSTVLYSEGRDGGPVTSSDLQLDTPYNTYLHVGLTPTPICFPSPASLRAALDPTPGNWLWFELVSKDGTEAFETTYQQHQQDIALARSRGLP